MQCKNEKTRILQSGNRNARPLMRVAKDIFEDHVLEEKLTDRKG